jgi:hypothetical protein
MRVTELEFRMTHASIWLWHAHDFDCAENLFVKIDCGGSTFDYQIGSDVVIPLGNWSYFVCHKYLLAQQ